MHQSNIKLPFTDFFTKWEEQTKKSVLEYGIDSRLKALEYVKNFDVVIDIGSHVGISVLHWSKHFKKIIGYEPMIDHYKCLQYNTSHLDNIELHNMAISNTTKIMQGAYRTTKNSGSFALLPDNYIQPDNPKKQRKIYNIPSHKLDDFEFEKVDLIKIDVEGWELEVLKGAINTIKKHKPVLLVEFTGGDWKKSFKPYDVNEYYQLIDDIGYKFIDKVDIDSIYVAK